jgi:hypothetical protein
MGKYQFTVRMKCLDCIHFWFNPKYDIGINWCPMCGSWKVLKVLKNATFKESIETPSRPRSADESR